MPVVVGGDDVAGIMVITSPGATASGRVVFEDGEKPDARLFVRTAATVPGATFSNTSVGVNPDMSFSASGLTERQTFRLGAVPEGWFLNRSRTGASTSPTPATNSSPASGSPAFRSC